MIQFLEIWNYQSHKHTLLDFSKGLNVIVGLSDAGKSAILRTLRWILFNQPLGESFRSNWGGDTRVKLTLDDNQTVERIRKTGFNGYVLNGKSKFEAIKSGIPDEVLAVVNTNELNLQQQLDSPFMLSNSSGEVAKMFNKIARLDKIDLSNSNINSWIVSITQTIKSKQEDLKKKIDDFKTYDYLDNFEKEVILIEQLQTSYNLKNNKVVLLHNLIENINETEEQIELYQSILSIEKDLNEILGKIEQKTKMTQDYTRLNNTIKSLQRDEQKIKSYENILTQESNITKVLNLYKDKNNLQSLFVKISEVELKLKRAEFNYTSLHEKFDKEMPNICPLCEQEIKK
jgi:DNA repair protein SbcC/Rad50